MIQNKIINFFKNIYNFSNPLDNFHLQKKIAVIGNSELIKKKKFGDLIDQHDFIIRFNRAPVSSYEKFVGKKTNLRVVGEGVFQNKEYEIPGLAYVGKNANFIKNLKNENILLLNNKKKEFYIKNQTKFTSKNNKIFFFDMQNERILKFKISSNFNIFKKYIYYKKKEQFTSGMLIISLLLLKNYTPSIFGFSLEKLSDNYSNYWGGRGIIKNPVHDLQLENTILKNWINKKKVIYYK